MLFAKLIIVALLLGIVVSLFSGLFFMMRDNSRTPRMLTSLKLRVGLSIALMLFLLLSWSQGWIQPHGVFAPR